MKYEEIMKLLNAGFTKDEIMAMQTDENADESKAKEETDTGNEDGADGAEDVGNTVSVITEALAEIKTTFDDFKKEITAMNIMNSRIESEEQSADDILANVINPFESK